MEKPGSILAWYCSVLTTCPFIFEGGTLQRRNSVGAPPTPYSLPPHCPPPPPISERPRLALIHVHLQASLDQILDLRRAGKRRGRSIR